MWHLSPFYKFMSRIRCLQSTCYAWNLLNNVRRYVNIAWILLRDHTIVRAKIKFNVRNSVPYAMAIESFKNDSASLCVRTGKVCFLLFTKYFFTTVFHGKTLRFNRNFNLSAFRLTFICFSPFSRPWKNIYRNDPICFALPGYTQSLPALTKSIAHIQRSIFFVSVFLFQTPNCLHSATRYFRRM